MDSTGAGQTDEPSPLRIHLEYDYLLAEDVTNLLESVRAVYEQVFWSDVPTLIGTPHQRLFGVQVSRADTSHSILLELQALGQTVAGLDPTLTGIGGGAVALGLAARILIHTFTAGHRALSEAEMRRLEIQARRDEIAVAGAGARQEIERAEINLEIVRRDIELRDFIQSALSAMATADYARAVARNEPVMESLGGALLNGWSVLQNDNIRTASINEVVVKPIPDGDPTADQQDAERDPGSDGGESGNA